MTAEEFLDQLQEQGLLEEKLIASLRRQVQDSKQAVPPQAIAKLLVDKGQLTAFQVKKLLPDAEATKQNKPPGTTSKETSTASDSSIGKVPTKSPPASQEKNISRPTPRQAPPNAGKQEEEIVELEDASGLTPLTEEDAIYGGAGDSLMDVASMETANPLMPGMASPAGGRGAPNRKKVKRGQWDSSLMLVGGGVLMVLLIGGIVLILSLFRGSADKLFNEANQDYTNSSYSQAIVRYNKYLKNFPQDKNASLARVKRGLAQLQIPVKSKNWPGGLKSANKVLREIENEDKFSEARNELATLLPDISEGFSEKAKSAGDRNEMSKARESFELAEQSMALVNNGAYIPTSLRKTIETRIDRIDDTLTEVKRLIDQDKKLIEAIADIDLAIDEGRTYDAYVIRKTLLRSYPGVEQHKGLQDAVQRITAGEREQVKAHPQTIKPQTEDEESVSANHVVLASRRGSGIKESGGQVIPITVRGSVYGLDVASGDVLWRRFVGYETTSQPQMLSLQKGGDALLVSRLRNELLRVKAGNGDLNWKLPIAGAVSNPIIAQDRIFVSSSSWAIKDSLGSSPQWWSGATQEWSADAADAQQYDALPDAVDQTKKPTALAVGTGMLTAIDASTGEIATSVQFPQPLPVGPAYDAKRSKLYQVGEHSNVYVLSGDQLECEEVYYLNHRAGSVVVPPLATRGFLLVADNSQQSKSVLHILSTDENGSSLKKVQEFPLKGHVVVPMRRYDSRILVVTDLGEAYFLDVNPKDESSPISVAAKHDSATEEPRVVYPLAKDGLLWLAGSSFTKFKIQTILGQLNRQWIQEDGTEYISPLRKVGQAVIRIQRIPGSLGVHVSAVDLDDAATLWETDLGSPLVGPIVLNSDGKQALAVSSNAELFGITQDFSGAKYNNSPLATASPDGLGYSLSSWTDLGGGRSLFSSPLDRRRVVVHDPQREAKPLSLLSLKISSGLISGAPVSFQNGILVPTDIGQVFLLDLKTGANLLLQNKPIFPFQPPLEAGVKIAWQRPVVIGQNRDEFVIADDRKRMFRVGIKNGASPHLSILKQTELDSEIISPLAALGKTVYAVTREPENLNDILISWTLPALSLDESPITLNGRFNLGPRQVGEVVFLSTDTDELLCLGSDGKIRWKVKVPYGPLAGPPVPEGEDFLLLSRSGVVWLVDGESGEEIAQSKVVLGEPLAAGATVADGQLWLRGADGTVHRIPMLKR